MIEAFSGVVPQLHPSSWVHASAVIIGEVSLAEQVSVWPTAVLRGDVGPIVIGACSNIQDGVICHDTTGESATVVGERCTVGHRAILHGCTLEDEVLVGMGAIVMDHARVGAQAVIGAGTVVTPGTVIPPRSLVLGVPGRVVRPVTDDELARIGEAWRTYVAKAAVWRGKRG